MPKFSAPLFAILLLGALHAGGAAAQTELSAAPAETWISYRDAYRAMLRFEKYGKPKHWLQSNLQLVPRSKGVSHEGLQLHLRSASLNLLLPIDASLRIAFPFLKAAYDDNAVLVLNRKDGQFAYQPLVSLVTRSDGVYDLSDVRTACEQALNYRNFADASGGRGQRCTGLEVVYHKDKGQSALSLRFRKTTQELVPVPPGAIGPFARALGDAFVSIPFRLEDWPDQGQLVLTSTPLAILALIE
jgi:hypothetical protein